MIVHVAASAAGRVRCRSLHLLDQGLKPYTLRSVHCMREGWRLIPPLSRISQASVLTIGLPSTGVRSQLIGPTCPRGRDLCEITQSQFVQNVSQREGLVWRRSGFSQMGHPCPSADARGSGECGRSRRNLWIGHRSESRSQYVLLSALTRPRAFCADRRPL